MTSRRAFFADVLRSGRLAMTMREDAHGLPVSLLGYGAMRYPTVDGSHANTRHGGSTAAIDVASVQRQIDYAIAHGVNYFDTSPAYCRGESEKVLGDALARHPRSTWRVATKMSNFAPAQQTAEGSKAIFERSLKLLHTDYFDFYLLHSCGQGGMKPFAARFLDNGILDWLVEQRAAGRIRNLGFSFHGDEKVFDWLLDHHGKYHWDFVQIQLNYVDWRHAKEVNRRNVNAERLYDRIAVKLGIPVVVMEPLLGGRLARQCYDSTRLLTPLDPAATPARWAFRFAGTHPKVLTVLSGMTYIEHMEENVETFSPLKPLNAREMETLEQCARFFLADNSISCTACDYCMPCPYGLDIPRLFSFWNDHRTDADCLVRYEREFPRLRRAEHCIGCGQCEAHCPQQIDIPGSIRRIDETIERMRRDR